MHTIIPHLWFDTQAKEAAAFYTEIFPESRVTHTTTLTDTPSGSCDVVSFELWGTPFMAISAGPLFTFTPAISFMVNFDPSQDPDARTRIDEIWAKLCEGGKVMMPLEAYPFSDRYGWVQDKYGLSWQLILTRPDGGVRPTIMPSLLFTGKVYGKAEEATDLYLSVFKGAERGVLARYPSGMAPHVEGTVMFTDFTLENTWFTAMDGAGDHDFAFNEAISFLVQVDTQEELDAYWSKLSAVPEAEQCGWLKDAYGVSWQIVPRALQEVMTSNDQAAIDRVTQAFLPMKKLDIATLNRAVRGG